MYGGWIHAETNLACLRGRNKTKKEAAKEKPPDSPGGVCRCSRCTASDACQCRPQSSGSIREDRTFPRLDAQERDRAATSGRSRIPQLVRCLRDHLCPRAKVGVQTL